MRSFLWHDTLIETSKTHYLFKKTWLKQRFILQNMIDIYSYFNPLIAGVVIFILISMLIAAVALYRKVYESESCANLQPVKLLNYLRYQTVKKGLKWRYINLLLHRHLSPSAPPISWITNSTTFIIWAEGR